MIALECVSRQIIVKISFYFTDKFAAKPAAKVDWWFSWAKYTHKKIWTIALKSDVEVFDSYHLPIRKCFRYAIVKMNT